MTKNSKSKRGRKQRRKAKVDVAVTAVSTHNDEPLEVKMERLQLNVGTAEDEDDLLEEAIKLAAAEKREIEAIAAKMNCTHGYESDAYIVSFYRAVYKVFEEARAKDSARSVDIEVFDEIYEATLPNFADVWNDSANLAAVFALITSVGTAYLLKEDKTRAHYVAYLACCLEQFVKVRIEKTQAELDYRKLFELGQGDDHTLTSFFKKRIPCSCLNEIYKEVKSLKKKGVCWNVDCKHSFDQFDTAGSDSEWKLDRSSLMSCSRCRQACYCSIECQKADWPIHKSYCDKTVAIMIAFEEAKCYQAT